jgi:hypothetical protein
MNDAYEEYEKACMSLGFTPCTFNDWQIQSALIDEHHIPYVSNIGTLWVHDIRKKTQRTDRPFSVFMMRSIRS